MTYDPNANQGFGAPYGPAEGSDQAPPAWGAPPQPAGPRGQYGGGYGGGYGGYVGNPSPGVVYGGYPSPGYYPPVARRTEGMAIAALVLAIVSFVVCPVIPAIVALAMVPSARRNIEASGGALEGLGLLTAAKIVSWINLGLWFLLICFYVVVFVVIATNSSTGSTALGLGF